MESGQKTLNFVSALPFSEDERRADARSRQARHDREIFILRWARQLGIPPGAPSRSLVRFWARRQGERDDAA